jgi:hypothetical protein
MSDLQLLLVVLVALYFTECLVVARRGSVIVRLPWFLGGASAAPPSKAMGNGNVGLALLNPLPPFGRVYVVEPWPFVCDDTSVVAAQSTSLWRDPKPKQSGQRLAFSAITDVGTIDKDIFVNDAVFATASSARHARAAAAALKAMWQAPPEQRAAVRASLLKAAFDVDDARARLALHQRRGLPLLVATIGTFAAMFVVTPTMVNHEGVERWFVWLGLIYVWVVLSSLLAFFAHKKLSPTFRGERWLNLLVSTVAPTVAIRGNDKLGRFLLAGLHPVTSTLVLLQGAPRTQVVGALLRDLRQPRLPTLPVDDVDSLAIEASFRREVSALAEATAVTAGIDVAALFVAPGKTAKYCPRCHTGYTKGSACADCGGVVLVDRSI